MNSIVARRWLSLNMGVLTEVSNEEELERHRPEGEGGGQTTATCAICRLTLTAPVSWRRLGPDVTVISESGIHTYAEVRERATSPTAS